MRLIFYIVRGETVNYAYNDEQPLHSVTLSSDVRAIKFEHICATLSIGRIIGFQWDRYRNVMLMLGARLVYVIVHFALIYLSIYFYIINAARAGSENNFFSTLLAFRTLALSNFSSRLTS